MSRSHDLVKCMRIVEDGLADPISRVIQINGASCVVRMERAFWTSLSEVARESDITIHQLISETVRAETASGATVESAIRAMLINHFQGRHRVEPGGLELSPDDHRFRVA
jgi:predicted DNA-binding ribbon-helix-helix protein